MSASTSAAIISAQQKQYDNDPAIVTVSASAAAIAASTVIVSAQAQDPVDVINDIRSFCYGPSRDKLNQMVNMMAMVQMLQLMNQPADGEKEDSHE